MAPLRNIFDQYEVKENHITNSLLIILQHNHSLRQAILQHLGIRFAPKELEVLSQSALKKDN
ncbi:MAG TPA: hypothetical protein DF383_09025, partial [Deltaproteobacteria bacterium]|nr:hypothetical protein [Deltaproteobacteria bacterium]